MGGVADKKRLFVSFSGGETSGFMVQWAKQNLCGVYDEMVFVFANTGQENEETLRFADQCDKAFDLELVWVEAKVVHGQRKSTGHRVVSYETAARNGEPFEEMIRKYGISNAAFPHCTRELKMNPLRSYIRSIGWTNYDTAIGIRVDEIDRMSQSARANRLIYPLVSMVPMTKPQINAWWSRQPFRLWLKGYEGNCKWCWKKSLRKHLTLITEHPEWYDFPERMESEYSLAGTNPLGVPRRFFREHRTVVDLRALATQGGWKKAVDDAVMYDDQLELDLDSSNGCSESCEIDFDEVV